MLRIFHNKKITRWIWIALIVIIGPAFVLWGVGSFQKSGKENGEDFGTIFGRKVSRQEYVSALKMSQLQMRMQFGESYEELLKFIDLKQITTQRLVLQREAQRRHIRVSDRDVVAYIQKDPSFARNGRFDPGLYESAIKYYLHMPAREYEEQVRQNIAIHKLSELTSGTPEVTDAEVHEAYRKENEKIDLDYASAIPADFAASVTVADDELKEYFAKNSLNFKQPLSFNLEYVMTDKEHQVTAINSRLEKEPLEKIAKDMGMELKETGLFSQTDAIPGIGWSQELSAQLPDAKPGKVFAPLEMEKKYYVLRLKERKEPYVPEFEPVKEKVRTAIVKERIRKLAKDKIDAGLEKLKAEAAKNAAFDMPKTATALGLKTAATGMFKFGSYLEGIGTSDTFYTKGNALKDGELSEVIEMPSGFYILRLKGREMVDEKKFEAEKDKVKEKLLSGKKSEIFNKYVEELVKKALQ